MCAECFVFVLFFFVCFVLVLFFFFFQAEDGIRDVAVTGVQTCALPISSTDLLPKGKVVYYLGYDALNERYKFLNRDTMRVITSSDVSFHVDTRSLDRKSVV